MDPIAATPPAPFVPVYLRCEYLHEPVGVTEAAPRLSWRLQATAPDARDLVQSACHIEVATSHAALEEGRPDLWSQTLVSSRTQVAYHGPQLPAATACHWRVRSQDASGRFSAWSPPAHWTTGLFEHADWAGSWIGPPEPDDPDVVVPPSLVRKEFELAARPAHALVFVTSLGVYDLYVNGARVSERLLAPEWTSYRHRVQVQAFDVTALLEPGLNAIGAVLADGWFCGQVGLGAGRGVYGPVPRLLAQLQIDGAVRSVVSDSSWRLTTDGPVRRADVLDGETIDARLTIAGWSEPGFDDGGWSPVSTAPLEATPLLVGQPNEPIRAGRVIAAQERRLRPDGTTIVDFGEDLAGVCRLRLRGPSGSIVTARHGEALEPDGSLYRANLRIGMGATEGRRPLEGAKQEDVFVLAGTGNWELFEPRFTYHGFRYVELHGLSAETELGQVEAVAVGSDLRRTGEFDCSEPLFREIVEATCRTQRSNSVGVPTDCPQRDERLGWAGDAQAFAGTACLLHDSAAFFTKWLADVRDTQLEDGRLPDIAPNPFDPPFSPPRFYGNPAWADAGVLLPWALYRAYGDTRILERSFESARRWIDWIASTNPDLLFIHGKPPLEYGDWLNGDTIDAPGWPTAGAEMPKPAFATAWFAHSTRTLARIAAVLGHQAEAKQYDDLADRIAVRFCESFVDDQVRIEGDTQAGYAIALHFGLLPRTYEAAAVRHLVEAIAERGSGLSTGIQSTLPMMLELSSRGEHESAVQLARRRDIPSWGYMLDSGATTIWERWDGYVPGRGFQQPIMNSFNHAVLGAVVQWMFEAVAGLRPVEDEPGYARVWVEPKVGCGLTWAKARVDTMQGEIQTEWRLVDGELQLELVLPPNTGARVIVPSANPSSAVAEPARTPTELAVDAAHFVAGSGAHRFRAPAPRA